MKNYKSLSLGYFTIILLGCSTQEIPKTVPIAFDGAQKVIITGYTAYILTLDGFCLTFYLTIDVGGHTFPVKKYEKNY